MGEKSAIFFCGYITDKVEQFLKTLRLYDTISIR